MDITEAIGKIREFVDDKSSAKFKRAYIDGATSWDEASFNEGIRDTACTIKYWLDEVQVPPSVTKVLGQVSVSCPECNIGE